MSPVGASMAMRPSLRKVLRRKVLAAVLLGVMVAACLLALLSVAALRSQSASKLQLVARSAGYMVEPALVFNDPTAAVEALAQISTAEDVDEAWVFDRHGRLLAGWSRTDKARWQRMRAQLARMLLPPSVEQAVMHEGSRVGTVRMQGAGGELIAFVLSGAAAIMACLVLSALTAAAAMQRTLLNILAPLQELGAVVRTVRTRSRLDRRVPEARISEFHDLGQDVNALLTELEARHEGLERENAHLAHRATHDSLTGLRNRADFEQRLASAAATADVAGGRFAVMFLDADRFKQINDSLGHEAGDAVLVAIARRIRRQVREADMVSRLGGDEFAVLIDGLTDVQHACRIVDAIHAAMDRPIALPGGARVAASLSIGLAVFPDDAHDAAALLRAADAAMYRRKRRRAR